MNSAKTIQANYKKKDGSAAIYLLVIINRKVKRIDLNIPWPVKFFNKVNGLCKPRTKEKDQLCIDNNLIIGQVLAKANEIFTTFRLSGRNLTMENFLREYYSNFSKQCFLSFYEHRMMERWKTGDITDESKKQHNNTLNKLKEFSGGNLLFNELDYKFGQRFENYLKKKKLKQNTRWGHHKDVKTYLNQARRNHFKFENPYEFFTLSPVPGGWASLAFEEREKLYQYYLTTQIGTSERRILQKFLFGCYSGLRISDQNRLREEFLNGGELKFTAWKTRKYGKEIQIPLLNRAIDLMHDSLRENRCAFVFWNYSEQFANRKLKEIAKKDEVNIKKNLHHHVGRETFGTLFTEAGGSVEELMYYFDHTKITTTMKYVHVKRERVKKRIDQMNQQ